MVTRHITENWVQVDQETQGLSLQVVAQVDGVRISVAYWYTYGADRKPTWFIGIGDLIDNRIEYELFESTDVGFMQDQVPGNDSARKIGTMVIVFDSCDSGVVTYDTDHEEVGSGSFNIERLLAVMNTHCTGGISDDMHVEPEADAFKNFTLNFSNIETHVEGDFAWAIADTEIKATLKSDGRKIDNKGHETFLFRKLDGQWKVVHTHSSSRPVKR
jgi:hypothetical protein